MLVDTLEIFARANGLMQRHPILVNLFSKFYKESSKAQPDFF